jgi:hypothetical protein
VIEPPNESTIMTRILGAALAILCAVPAFARDKAIAPDQLEFFEKKVRPVLVQHCFECHSAKAKKVKAGLLLDSRAGMLEGGDNGPALVPGNPDKSRLIEAIRYTNVDLRMPRGGKLPDAVIADLRAWVKMGAPWPDEKQVKKNPYGEFDLQKRKNEHWCWQPVRAVEPPSVKGFAWPHGAVDRFVLAGLEAKGLKPAADADPRTLVRRLYFDLIGLPPSREEVGAFVSAWDAAGKNRQKVVEELVDKLLASPQFGERWGRHWLDLVRYAESRGHEFDYTIPNAYQYRDYVVRAFNADIPYNQFVTEHLAGDLLPSPRLHKDGFNESILGTAFWFLGEEVHSPVDIRMDQADRFDNRIDVMTKTFLGLTVACARCHDHKFDAISTRDYYALFGILESSNYRLARFDTITQNRKIAAALWEHRKKSRAEIGKAFATAAEPTIDKLDAYLLAAAGIEDRAKGLDPVLLKRWQQKLAQAAKDMTSPLHLLAIASADRKQPVKNVVSAAMKDAIGNVNWFPAGRKTVVDYGAFAPPGKRTFKELVDGVKTPPPAERDWTGPWLPDDVAFGPGPVPRGAIVLGPSANRPITRVAMIAAAERDRAFDGIRLAAGAQNESGSLGGAMRSGRTLRTPEFTLEFGKAYALVKGSGMIYAAVGQHIMLAGPLHGSLIQKFNTGDKFQWVTVNLMPYQGQRLHLEFTPDANADFALAAVVQATEAPPPYHPAVRLDYFNGAETLADIVKGTQRMFRDGVAHLEGNDQPEKRLANPEAANWLVQNSDLFFQPDGPEAKALAKAAAPIMEVQQKLIAQLRLDSRLAPAMQDGSGTDEAVFTRGNPRMPGVVVPRRYLEALAGPHKLAVKSGSGRLELAQQMTDPAVTPLIARVYVNRVWHHLFGRGIVASVDNFGVLGEAPTHPELLDYLAAKFVAPSAPSAESVRGGDGWSTKKLIRALVLSRAYQMSSAPDAKADEADPGNLLLHRMRLRRLEGEAIRDSILKVSGRLNPAMYGPSVPVYLTPFQDGRGRPGSGPLDGDGRRSIYLAVRRNFLSPFLLAFDAPAPFSTVGRRTVSNVPAQALILMNDPFVHQQADLWAKRVAAETGSTDDRVRGMYLDAFARPPSAAELRACTAYLGSAPDVRRWADLAHVLINTKEFFFLN